MLADYLVPKDLKKLTKEREEELVKWYREDLPDPHTVTQEIERWRYKFAESDEALTGSCLEMLNETYMPFFPNIHCMLKSFLTLSVTTCACKRSFSAMRRLKTWLRASMSDDRLSGLALMHVHNNIKINKESVLRRWDASGHRRIHLAFRKVIL